MNQKLRMKLTWLRGSPSIAFRRNDILDNVLIKGIKVYIKKTVSYRY